MPPPSAPTPKATYHHGDLRTALLEAAVVALREGGIAGLSLRDCARRVGVSHAAPYRHFASKDLLLAAIAGQGFAWLAAAGRAAMAGQRDPQARLDAYGQAYVRFAVAHPEHFRVMFTAQIADCTEADQEVADAAFGLLRDAVAAVQAASPDAAIPDADTAAVAYWSRPHGLAMLLLDGRVPPEAWDTPQKLAALVHAALG